MGIFSFFTRNQIKTDRRQRCRANRNWRRSADRQSRFPTQKTPPAQTFILEPILTPSAGVGGIEDSPDPGLINLDAIDLIGPDRDPAIEGLNIAANSIPDPETAEVPLAPLDFIAADGDGDPLEFQSGVFTVGAAGEVEIDFLFDGGAYRGQLAIFSLDNIWDLDLEEPFNFDNPDHLDRFIEEAASRSLSHSELGHIVISDPAEGARFTGQLGEQDWNSGEHLEGKSFAMNPGDEVGFMLVPKGTVKQVWRSLNNNTPLRNELRPLFSMNELNPDQGFQMGRLADLTGNNNAYAFEDLRLDLQSDLDYNDLIFQVGGATDDGIDIINPEPDWRGSDLGMELTDYVSEQIDADPPEIVAALANDTGLDNADSITSDPTITGSVSDASGVFRFQASFNDTASTDFINVTLEPDGSFSLDRADLDTLAGGTLANGSHTLHLQATDPAGFVSDLDVPFILDTEAPETPSADLTALSDSGLSNSDNLTNLTAPTLHIEAEPGSQVQLFLDDAPAGTATANLDGIAEFSPAALSDGIHEVSATATDLAGNVSPISEPLALTIDTVPPTSPEFGLDLIADTGTVGDLTTELETVTLTGQTEPGATVELLGTGLTKTADTTGRFSFTGVALALGQNSFTVRASDAAGNKSQFSQLISRIEPIDPQPPTDGFDLEEIAPINGEELVSLTRKAIVRFKGKVDPATVNDTSFYLIANGEVLPGRVVVSSTEEFATFYPDEPLPPSTEVRIVLDGDQIRGRDGTLLDGDRDGTPGGILTADFRTQPLTRIPGTDVFGYVFDSHHTNPDGTNIPIVGATIRVDALPDVTAVTDANGRFLLEDLPAPDFSVHIDGSTATNAPAGLTYPTVGKTFHSIPGQATQLTMDGEPFDVFLPAMDLADFQALDSATDTNVGFGATGTAQLAAMFPEIDPAAWNRVQVTFPPNSAQDDFGNPATQATIIPVDPERLPGPLPPHLDATLVISIQAPGATNFDVPAPVTFPNLDGLPPGEKATLWSFNHDAGRWEPIGLGTVSADGQVITSDPGVGIRAPGWHRVSPPLNWTGSDGQPLVGPVTEVADPEIFVELFASGQTSTLSFEFTPPPGSGDPVGDHDQPVKGTTEPKRIVEIDVEGDFFEEFFDNSGDDGLKTTTKPIEILPGQDPVRLSATLRTLEDLLDKANGGKPFNEDVVYGAKITVKETVILADGSSFESSRIIVPYLYVDQSDDNAKDLKLKFADTIEPGPIRRQRDYTLKAPTSLFTDFSFQGTGDFNDIANSLVFDPSAEGQRTATMKVRAFVNGTFHESASELPLEGRGLPRNKIFLNKVGLEATLEDIADGTAAADVDPILLTANEIGLFDTAAERTAIANAVEAQFRNHYSNFADAIEYVNSVSGDTLALQWQTQPNTPHPGSFGTSKILATDDGVDSVIQIDQVITDLPILGQAQQNFRIAQATNTDMETNVYVYVDNHLEWSYTGEPHELNVNQVVNALAYTAAHEAGHTLGLMHTAKITDLNNTNVEQQRIGLVGGNAGSTFRLSFKGEQTTVLPRNATAAAVEAALEALPTIGAGNVTVVGNDGGPYTILFIDDLTAPTLLDGLELIDLPQIAGTGTNGLNVTVNTLVQGSSSPVFGTEIVTGGTQGRTDIMAGGGTLDVAGNNSFQNNLSGTNLKLGLKLEWLPAEAQRALSNYVQNFSHPNGGPFNTFGEEDDGALGDSTIEGPMLAIFDSQDRLVFNGADLGIAEVDGAGGSQGLETLRLLNIGNEAIVLDAVDLVDATGAFAGATIAPGTTINPGEDIPLDLIFDPLAGGDFAATLAIASNDRVVPNLDLDLTGFGRDPDPVFQLELLSGNNNLGGAVVGTDSTQEEFIAVTNQGATDLVFTPTVTAGAVDFSLGSFEGVEQTLAFGESLLLPISFAPTTAGLRPGTIEFVTNDPDRASVQQGVVVTGLPDGAIELDWGQDFAAIEYNNFLQRTVTNQVGDFMFELPTFNEYDLSIFDPESGLIAGSKGLTGAAGAFTGLTSSLDFRASIAPDRDFDGLPDDIEFAIGTDVNRSDTDGDGLSDFAEIENQLDPVGGQGFPTGIIASLPLRGEARSVVVAGSTTTSGDQTAYVATGTYGLAIVDASEFDTPIVLGQLNLPGTALDVGVDADLQIAAVTTANSLQLVDVSDPMLPKVLHSLPISANKVQVFDGIAYATVGTSLRAIDLLTGEELQSLTLPGSGNTFALARDGSTLYAYKASANVFSTIDISTAGAAQVLGQVSPTRASGTTELFVADGVAYLTGGGYRTINVSDPTEPKEISPFGLAFTSRGIALNGSGLALIAGEVQGVSVYDASDPENTNNRITTIDTPGFAWDVAIASGIGYVADGASGLHVVNYLPFDNQGEAPTVSISSTVEDLDPSRPGIQVEEGTSIPIEANISDDLQVRNVELLVNGEVVSNDVSFPFDLKAIALGEVPDDETLEVQVRATDTGGNVTLSNLLSFSLVGDITAPTIASINPADGQATAQNIRRVEVRFSESMDLAGLTADNFQLMDGADAAIAPENIQIRSDDRIVQLTYAPLSTGDYRLAINAAEVKDRAGNPLGTGEVSSSFSIVDQPIGFDDPQGDTFGNGTPIDIKRTSGSITGNTLTLTMEFFNSILAPSTGDSTAVTGLWELDLDQDPNTGNFSRQSLFAPVGQQGGALGVEAYLDLASELSQPGRVNLVDASNGSVIGTVPITYGPDVLQIEVPLSLLGDDGLLNYGTIVGDFFDSSDAAPNDRVGTV